MLIKTNKQLILNNKELLKERYVYSILLMIINNDGNLLVSNDDNSVIIAQSTEKYPIRIYQTVDD